MTFETLKEHGVHGLLNATRLKIMKEEMCFTMDSEKCMYLKSTPDFKTACMED